MECRGAIHCAHLGSRGIPQGAMNCAPTPCAYLKGIDPCGQPGGSDITGEERERMCIYLLLTMTGLPIRWCILS